MSFVLDRLDELIEQIADAVAASTLPDKDNVTVSDDGRDIATAKSARAGAIIVYPFPVEEYPAPKTTRLEWAIAIVADGDSARDASERVHALTDLLRKLGIIRAEDSARPTNYALPDRSTIPGYTITHIEEHH